MGDKVPQIVLGALINPNITKWAFNAQFEGYVSLFLGLPDTYLSPQGWKCSMTWAASLGLPFH